MSIMPLKVTALKIVLLRGVGIVARCRLFELAPDRVGLTMRRRYRWEASLVTD